MTTSEKVISRPVIQPEVLIVAAECKGLAKVGGLGDVVCDLSVALHKQGAKVAIVLPCYGSMEIPASAVPFLCYRVQFGEKRWQVEVLATDLKGVPVYLLKNDPFFGGKYSAVYIDSRVMKRGPFEDDAKRFAFFSAAVLELLRVSRHFSGLKAIHCHDWHTGSLLFLLHMDKRYKAYRQKLNTVFTIHNLHYQGSRPFEENGGRPFYAFSDWFPALYREMKEKNFISRFKDPNLEIPCYNPMRTGILLADYINTVSPTYAEEITLPDIRETHFFGGRGLEEDLRKIKEQNRLFGILNGIDYDEYNTSRLKPSFEPELPGFSENRLAHKTKLLMGLKRHLEGLRLRSGTRCANFPALRKKLERYDPGTWLERPLIVSVSRATDQKISILLEKYRHRKIISLLLRREAGFIFLGNGELSRELAHVNRHENGFFVCAFDKTFADMLYAGGDLFLMPSDFEPCGISQLIAMRCGCLPLAHDIGGLRDTIRHEKTGFLYRGGTREEAKAALLSSLDRALACYRNQRDRWLHMQGEAMKNRFLWQNTARKYLALYKKDGGE